MGFPAGSKYQGFRAKGLGPKRTRSMFLPSLMVYVYGSKYLRCILGIRA